MDTLALRVFRQWLAANGEFLKIWLPVLLSAATLLGLIGSALGLLVVNAYLNSVDAPFPLADPSAAFVLLIVAAEICFGVTVLGGMLLLPVWLCSVSQRERQHVRRRRFQWEAPLRRRIEGLGSQHLLFQSAPIAMIGALTLGAAANLTVRALCIWAAVAVIGAILASGSTFYVYVRFEDRIRQRFGSRFGRMRACLALLLVRGLLWRTFWCFLWFILIVIATSRLLATHGVEVAIGNFVLNLTLKVEAISQLFAARGVDAASIGNFVVYVSLGSTLGVVYWLLTAVVARIERVPLILVFWMFAAVSFGSSYSGRIALRALGIGGGIPATITVRTMEVGASIFVAKPRTGCLILNVGGQVILREQDNPTPKSCGALSRQPNDPPTPLLGIRSYSRADVLEITRYEVERRQVLPETRPHS